MEINAAVKLSLNVKVSEIPEFVITERCTGSDESTPLTNEQFLKKLIADKRDHQEQEEFIDWDFELSGTWRYYEGGLLNDPDSTVIHDEVEDCWIYTMLRNKKIPEMYKKFIERYSINVHDVPLLQFAENGVVFEKTKTTFLAVTSKIRNISSGTVTISSDNFSHLPQMCVNAGLLDYVPEYVVTKIMQYARDHVENFYKH